MATDNNNIPLTGNDDGTQHDAGLEVIQLAENTPPSGGQGNAAPTANQPAIPGVPNGEVHVTIPAGQTVVRVQVAPGEIIDLPFDGALAAKFGQQGNLAIKLGDQTIILLGYAEANQQAGVTVKDDKGQTIDVASVVAQTDPNLDIQTAAGPAAGPAGAQGGHLFFGFAGGNGLGGFGELNVINPTELQYKLIQPDETIIVRAPDAAPPTIGVTGDLVVNEDDLHTGGDVSSEALIISGPSSALIDQLFHSPTFSNTYFTFYSGSQGNDPFDVNDHENGSQNVPPLPDDFVDSNGHHIDQDPEPLSVTAHVTSNLNGNVPGTLTFDHNGVTPVINQLNTLGLTSQGHPLSYELLPPDGTHGESVVAYYTVTYSYGEQQYSYNVIVFSLEVEQASSTTGQFDVTYTLYGPLDNAPHGAADTGAQGSGSAGEDIFFLDTTFFVSDSAGHTSQSAPGQMVFQTVDDVPQFGHMEYEYMPNGQLESYSYVPVQYDPANLTIGVDESAGQQTTHYTINNPDTSTGQVADQNTDDASSLYTIGYNSEAASLQATNDVLHDAFASDALGVLNQIDPSYFNDSSDHSQGFNAYIDTAQTFLDVSFGADGEAGTFTNKGEYVGNKEAGQTVFTGDGAAYATGFQLYMTSNHATLDNGGSLTTQVETNLTIGDGLKVIAYQIDADTIIGIAYPPQVQVDEVTNLAAVQANGIPVFTLHVDPETGALTLTEYHQINNPLGGDASNDTYANDAIQLLDSLGDQFVFVRATDFDGDYVDGGLAVSFIDDAPSIVSMSETGASIAVDETPGDQVGDSTPAGALSQNSTDISGLFATSYGTDGPGTTTFTLTKGDGTGFGTTAGNGTDSGLKDTATSTEIFLFQDGNTIEGHVGNDPNGPLAFTVSINGTTVTLTEYLALQHPDNTNPNDTMMLDGIIHVTGAVTDSDGDTATLTDPSGLNLTFYDDGPTISANFDRAASIEVDETPGDQVGDSTPAGALSQNSTDIAKLFNTADFGADGPAASNFLTYALTKGDGTGFGTTAGTGTDSGLKDTATSTEIYLFQNGNTVEGHVGNDPSGPLAFTISINGTTVTLTEILAIKHPDTSDANDSVSLNGIVHVTATATDGDGDTASATDSNGLYLTFYDDGPTVSSTGTTVTIAVDETAGNQLPGETSPGGGILSENTASIAGLFSPVNYGADGAGSTTYALTTAGGVAFGTTAGAGTDSGLKDTTTGQEIYLFQNGSSVEGHVGNNPAGALAFTISLNGTTVTLDQERAIQHPNTSNPNDSVSITGLVHVTETATDGDGDKAVVTDPSGLTLTFFDDGPTVTATNATASISVDETPGNQVGDSTPGGALSQNSTNVSGLFNATNYGADGPGSTTLSLTNGSGNSFGTTAGTGTDSGLKDTATKSEIYLFQNGSTVEGHVGNDPSGPLAFTITISGSTVTLTEILAIDHPDATNPNDSVTLNGIVHVTATAIDGDGDTVHVTDPNGLNLTFFDDAPAAHADTNSINSGQKLTVTAGSGVESNDVFGADGKDSGGGVVGVKAGTTVTTVTTGVDTDITGSFGTLHLKADGSYTYQAFANVGGVDHFVYTIEDGDGDLSTTTLDITVNKVGPDSDKESVTVNEAALDTTTTGNDLGHGTVTGSQPGLTTETATGALVLGSGVTVVGGNDQNGSFGILHVNANGTFTYTLTSNDLTNPPANDGTNTINNAETFTVTIKDADGNTNMDTITVNIIDDVPVVAASGTTVTISVDETPGNQLAGETSPGGGILSENTGSIAGLFNAVNFGADGPAASNSLVYALTTAGGVGFGTTAGTGTDSGLKDTATGQEIYVFQNGSKVEGHVGNDPAGALAFTVSLSGTTVTLDQYRAIQHPNTSDPNDTVSVAGIVFVTETATDGDGDKASVTSANGLNLTFYDDAPTDFHPQDLFAADKVGATVSGSLDITGHTGVDGFGAFSIDVTNGTKVTGMVGDTSQVLQSNGHDVYWFHVGNEVVGTTDPTGVDSSKIVFELIPNTGTDSYSFKLDQTIDNGAGLNFSTLSGAPAGQNNWIAVSDPSSASGDQLLITGFSQSDSVNTSSQDIGSNNQWIDKGEGIRTDLVIGATGSTTTANGFDFAHHYTATEMSFNVGQVKGAGTSGIQITLSNPTLDANNAATTFAQFTAETEVAILSIVIMNAGVDVTAQRTIDLSTGIVTNVHAGDTFLVTGTGSFERLEVDYHSDNSFSVNSFEVVSTVTGSPVEITAPTTITDGDGDKHTSSSGIDVTLYPTTDHIIDHHTNTTAETINSSSTDKVTSGTDVVIIGTGATTVDLGASGGHDTVVVSSNPSVAVHDVIQNFTDHTAGNAATESDHLDLDSVFDSLGVATANRAADVVITQNGANVDLTITGTNLTITLTGHTAANISVGTDHTHDIITGSL